ncbi:PAS domain-containing sensor histidine kinase [Streptomyces sp. B1866]|uniref:PAS domain-containing sensor histidine kinase n=1 Tax=Streptomyces sp. B1866 TaxID=3075431 RepID=UPI00289059C5|nr:PAS domain-containing sensor histidine kinase [Streptomyces sp. B1866]MDT3397385.1 PAS domain-containing sensor histidine kinase [Streptomyces sp. B1866]
MHGGTHGSPTNRRLGDDGRPGLPRRPAEARGPAEDRTPADGSAAAAPGGARPPGVHVSHDYPVETATLSLLVRNVVDYAIFLLDTSGHIASWNPGAERMKGYRSEEIIGKHFSVFYPPEDIAADKPGRELEIAVAEGRLEDEGWRVRQDGTRFWANVVITALIDDTGELRGFGKVTRDLTERRRAEQALTERRRLLSHLVEAQEQERRRIAWDVHDDSIQAMVAVGMRLQLLAGRIPEEHAAALLRLDESVRDAVTRLRSLTFRLRPPGIDRHGLKEALTSYLDDVLSGWGLRYTYRHSLDREPPPETAVTIFRICQEALTNVHRHARATAVAISCGSVDNGVLTRVTDDGVGIDPRHSALAGLEHFGTMEMRERAETAHGWWTMRPEPQGGTTVEFWLPLPPPFSPAAPAAPDLP